MMKRFAAIILVIVLLIGVLAGCNQEGQDTALRADPGQAEANVENPRGKYAYKAEYIPIEMPEGINISGIYNYCIVGDNMYFYGDCITGEEPYIDEITGEPVIDTITGEPFMTQIYETLIFRMDPETGVAVQLDTYEPASVPEGHEGNSFVSGIQPGTDGSVWITEQVSSWYFDLPEDFNHETDDPYMYYTQGENSMRLHQLSASGDLMQTVQLQVPQDTYLSTIMVLEDGRICATDWQGVLVYDSTGNQIGTISAENGINNLFRLEDGTLGAWVWKEDGGYLVDVDLESMAFGEEMKLHPNAYNLYPSGEEYDYIYDYNGTFYGYSPEEGEGIKLFSWLDCDVDSGTIYGVTQFAEDGRVFTLSCDYSQEQPIYQLVVLNPVDPSEIPVKQELMLACFYLDWDLRADIVAFNRSHDDVRIVVKEYSQYATEDDPMAGIQKLNTEIMSGSVPDLFLFHTEMPSGQYAAKGILMDLWPLIDADPELSREDLMTHFFDALSVDGKLYEIVDSFGISTLAGKASVVGSGSTWTMKDLMDALDQQPEGTTIFGNYDTKYSILVNCVSRSAESFIDWNTLQCSFDSQEFIDLLTFANQFPAEINHEDVIYEDIAIDGVDMESEPSMLRSGKQMLYRCTLYGFPSLQWANAVFGEPASFIGYPTTGSNGSCFEINGSLAISSTCANTDAAWSFIRTYLTEEHQTQDYMYQFPTNRHSFDALVEQAMTVEYFTDYETGEDVPMPTTSIWYGMEEELLIYAMTQEELDLFMEIYNNCSTFYSYDQEVTQLISEEAAAFFEGKKTAEETAKLIQDRVSLYVMENG